MSGPSMGISLSVKIYWVAVWEPIVEEGKSGRLRVRRMRIRDTDERRFASWGEGALKEARSARVEWGLAIDERTGAYMAGGHAVCAGRP